MDNKQIAIDIALYKRLIGLGIIDPTNTRNGNVGQSNYAQHLIQPWAIWMDWNLNPWDADIIKRVLRSKGDSPEELKANRILDYNKIMHICRERLRQLDTAAPIPN